jgi:hypothetical protein
MTSFRLNARRPIDPPADDGFEVSYVPDDGAVHQSGSATFFTSSLKLIALMILKLIAVMMPSPNSG